MPYKTIGFEQQQPQQEDKPSLLKMLIPAATRAAGGYLSMPGGPLGGLLAGGAEGIAQLEEGIKDIPKAIGAIPDVVRGVSDPETRMDTVGGFFEGGTRPLARIGTEAAIGSIPFAKVITPGKPWLSTAKSALLSGTGEAAREVARGQDIDPGSIGKATAIGGVFGQIFGRLGGGRETPPAGPSYEIEHTAVPGGRVLDASGKKMVPVGSGRIIQGTAPEVAPPSTPIDPRTAYWAKRGMNPPSAPGRMASAQYGLPFENITEEAVTGGRVPYMEGGAYPEGSAAKSAARAAKEQAKVDRDLAIQNRIDQAIEEGQLVPGKTAVSESGSVETPEGRMSYRRSYAAPKKEEGGEDAGFRVIQDEPLAEGAPIDEPVAPTPLEKVLKSATPKKPRAPRTPKVAKVLTPQQEAAQRSYDELLARLKAEGGGPPPETTGGLPVAPEGPSTPPPGPKWLRAGDVEPMKPLPPATESPQRFGSVDPYAGGLAHLAGVAPMEGLPEGSSAFLRTEGRIAPPNLSRGDIGPTLEGGVQVEGPTPFNLERVTPTFKGLEPVSEGGGVSVEGATQGLSPLAQLFKSRVDAAGQGYRDLKAALGTEPGLKEPTLTGLSPYQIAGKGLREEAQAVGLPTGGAPSAEDRLRAVFDPDARLQANIGEAPAVEPPVSGIGPSQTAKARAAALAKRQAARAAKEQEAAQQSAWLPDFEKELAEAQRMKEAGATPEQIQQTLSERLKGESGAIDPQFAATLARVATGAGLGGIFGGATGHPIAGAAIGGAFGLVSPSQISSSLQKLGMSKNAAEEAKITASTPEGVKGVAQKYYQELPQFQRFNLLMDAWGLPANAIAGPFGSATMGALEAHLNGDPRGAAALEKLANPIDFMKRWNVARQGEAQRLLESGEIGRSEAQVVGTGPMQQMFRWPGVQMTAGDVAARQILEEAGFSADEARRITLTSEPETMAAKRVANFAKGSPLLQLLQPFARTPANIAEQGAMRIPALGSAVQYLGRDVPDPFKLQMIQQGLGLASGAAGYAAGDLLPPEQARVARRFMTNLGGQYSLPVGIGFAMGQAARAGKEPLSAQTAANLYGALPLPSTAPIASWSRSALQGEPPRGVLPSALLDILSPKKERGNPLSPLRFRTVGF